MSEDMKNLIELVNKLKIRLISVWMDGTVHVYADGPLILKSVAGPIDVEPDETYEDLYTITMHVGKYRFVGTVSQEQYLDYIHHGKKEKVA